MQVELAHGGRGNSSSDRYNSGNNSGHNGGRNNHKFGAPKRTEYRGTFVINVHIIFFIAFHAFLI